MTRALRINYPDAVYHVTAGENARQPIVHNEADRHRFVGTLAAQYQVTCDAWVLMDNHSHLLVQTPQANLSAALRHLNGCCTQTFNRELGSVL